MLPVLGVTKGGVPRINLTRDRHSWDFPCSQPQRLGVSRALFFFEPQALYVEGQQLWMGTTEKLVSGHRYCGDEMPPFTPHLQVPQSQRQGPECFLGRCKYPGASSDLGAVELSVLWGSSASGAFGFPSRNPLTFSQGVCLHRPPLEYCAPSTPQWSTVGFCGKDLASQQYWDLSTSWPGIRGKLQTCLPLSSGLLEQWKGKG